MADRDSQQQQAANPDSVTAEAISSALKDIHTFLPGIIQSFDKDKQTAQVQPAIKRIFTEKGAANLPLCVDVPVHFLKAGGFCVTVPIAAGDECLLGFFERAIDKWYAAGGPQEPSEYRLHDLSDGFAIVGISSMPNVITDFNETDYEIRLLDGSAKISMAPDGTITQLNAGGSTVLTPDGIHTINANVVINGTTLFNGTIASSVGGVSGSFAGDISVDGISVRHHPHSGVVAGGDNSGEPIAS